MAKFLILSLCVALGAAAPAYQHGLAAAPLHGHASVAYSAPVVTEQVHAGAPVARTHVQHGVVGHQTYQAGTKTVQVGHRYVKTGETVHRPAPYSYVAGAPVNSQETRPLPLSPLPHAAPYAAIPPAPTNQGPAPADTVTHERVLAPVRTHTRITPQVTRIEPKLQVNRVPYDVPVPVPTPVERTVVVPKHVAKPYTVEVPTPVDVPVPHKVHPVHRVVETPVVREHTYTVHQPIVQHATVAHVAHAAPAGYALNQAVAAPAAAGYALNAGYGLNLAAAPAHAVAVAQH